MHSSHRRVGLGALVMVVIFGLATPAVAACEKDEHGVPREEVGELLKDEPVDWSCVDLKRADDRKLALELKDTEYGRRAGFALGLPAFVLRNLTATGQIGEGNATGSTLDPQTNPVTAKFGQSESTRRVEIGYKGKRVLEDLAVMVGGGPEALSWWEDLGTQHWNAREFLLKPITVDATFGYGKTVKLNGSDLDELKTSTDWSVTVKYTLPIDRLFGVDYKTE